MKCRHQCKKRYLDEYIFGLGPFPLLAFKTPFRLIPKLEILAAFKMGFSKEETGLRWRILASYIKGRYFAAKIDSEGNIMPLLSK